MKLTATIHLDSDFHIASGEGFAGTVDSVVMRDDDGTPVIPGSTLKGLCRWHAEQLLQLNPVQQMIPVELHAAALEGLFGSEGNTRGRIWFHDAVLKLNSDGEFTPGQVHGRSARDVDTGATQRGAYFRYEDAAAAEFKAELTSDDEPERELLLLLVMALRRIEAVGGQRRRGKGRCRVTVHVEQSDSALHGLLVPSGDERLRKAFDLAFQGKLDEVQREATKQKMPAAEQPGETVQRPQAESCLLLFARAVQPIVVTDEPETGNIIGTLDYLPGSVVRGALAHRLLNAANDWKPHESRFRDVFTQEQVRFGPLYPTVDRPRPGNETLSFPAPQPLQTCKYAKGVLESPRDAGRIHGAMNVLWCDKPARCRFHGGRPEPCNASLVPLEGYLKADYVGDGEWELRTPLPKCRSIQRTEIHDLSLSSQKQRLYSTEVIPAGTWFAGYVWGPLNRLQELADYVAVAHRNRLRLRLGKSLSRGHGAIDVTVAVADVNSHPVFPLLLPSAHQAGGALPECAVAGTPRGAEEFSLYLYSDMIAVDRHLRPVTHLDKDGKNLWQAVLGKTDDPPFEIVSGYCATRRVGGFNGVVGLPRTPDVALIAGSTWRLRWKQNGPARTAAIRALNDAVKNGVGLRRGEGFGNIIVNLPLLDFPLNQPADEEHRFEIPFGERMTLTLPEVSKRDPRTPREVHQWDRITKLHKIEKREVKAGLARLLATIADCDVPAPLIAAALEARKNFSSWHGKDAGTDEDKATLDEERVMQQLLDDSQQRPPAEFKNLLKQYARYLIQESEDK